MAKTSRPKSASRSKGNSKPKTKKPESKAAVNNDSESSQAWERGESVSCTADESNGKA